MPIGFASAEEQAFVETQQVRAFFEEVSYQNLAGAVVVSFIAYVVHEHAPTWAWLPALICLYGVTAMRAWLIWQYHHVPAKRTAKAWGLSQVIAAGLAGACWGFANTAMMAHSPTDLQLFVLTVISVSAAASSSLGYSYPAPSQAYSLLSLTPAIIWLSSVGDRLHFVLALLLLAFLATMLIQGRKRSRVFKEAQQIHFRNKQLANELKVERDAANDAYLAKTRFLAAASHDLRQPMHALSIYHELLSNQLRTSDSRYKLVQSAKQAADAMNTLLDALLDVSKLDANAVAPSIRSFPVQTLLSELSAQFGPIAEEKHLSLRVVPCSATITSDPILLGRVLRNLVSNAIRYTPSGRILVGCRRRAGQLAITVYDTGVGIPEEEREAIFKEFYQIGNKARDRELGIGLGLSIVRRIVSLLGHSLDLHSVPGRGSCFTVTVPLASAADAVIVPAQQDRDVSAVNPLVGAHVLVIDDEEPIRAGMAKLLESWGARVAMAGTYEEAEAWARNNQDRIDAVIADLNLPGQGDGIAAIAMLRKRYRCNLPALLATGDTSPDAIRRAEQANLLTLHKPIKPARLRSALTAVLMASGETAAA